MKSIKLVLLVAFSMIALAFGAPVFAADSFGISGGFGSSSSITGGGQAESGVNGTGYATQYSAASGYGIAAGGTALTAGFASNGFSVGVGAGSVSGTFQTSSNISTSSGYTTGGGYGDSKSGSAVNNSAYGYGNVSGSYSY